MARPADTNTEDTRRRILDAARCAFAESGFAAVSTRKLASLADVNVATLNYHFGSKQGIYEAVIDDVYERFETSGNALVPELVAADPATIVRRIYETARADRAGVRILLREIVDHGQLRDETAEGHVLPNMSRVADVIARVTGVDEARARALVVTLSFLISRFAVQTEASLQAALGCDSVDATEEAIVDILMTTTLSFLRT